MLLLAPGRTNTQHPGEVMLHLNHHSRPDRLRKTVLVQRRFDETQTDRETLINPTCKCGLTALMSSAWTWAARLITASRKPLAFLKAAIREQPAGSAALLHQRRLQRNFALLSKWDKSVSLSREVAVDFGYLCHICAGAQQEGIPAGCVPQSPKRNFCHLNQKDRKHKDDPWSGLTPETAEPLFCLLHIETNGLRSGWKLGLFLYIRECKNDQSDVSKDNLRVFGFPMEDSRLSRTMVSQSRTRWNKDRCAWEWQGTAPTTVEEGKRRSSWRGHQSDLWKTWSVPGRWVLRGCGTVSSWAEHKWTEDEWCPSLQGWRVWCLEEPWGKIISLPQSRAAYVEAESDTSRTLGETRPVQHQQLANHPNPSHPMWCCLTVIKNPSATHASCRMAMTEVSVK